MLKCVAYTSLAALDLDEAQLLAIHSAARDYNGLDGITGLLLFDGVRFLQWIEGPEQAIDDLVERLRRDSRHSAFEIREEQRSEERLFGDWTMELVRLDSPLFFSRGDVLAALPAALPESVRRRAAAMVADQAAAAAGSSADSQAVKSARARSV